MRQTQSNRRGRGRSRKAQNPLTKNFESNGPEIKIRGTAAHISEKYTSLARDAAASSDTVRHENYLQHAEHYNRIIATAQENAQAIAQANERAATSEDAEGGNQPVANSAEEQQAEGNNNNQNKKRNHNNRRRRPEGQRNNQSGRDGRQAKNSDDRAKQQPSEESANEKVEVAVQKIEPIVKEVTEIAPVETKADDAAA